MHKRPTAFQRAFLRAYGWATLRLYHELAWAYDPISGLVSAGRWDRWRRMALDHVIGPQVLELGFGTGELLLALDATGYAAYGLESSPQMHRVATRKLAARGRRDIGRMRGLAQALPFASGTFDTVVSTFPAGYILDRVALCEIARVLRRPDGRLVIAGLSVELPRSPRYPLSFIPSFWPQLWALFQRTTSEAGLSVELTWRNDPPARVPVVIARPSTILPGDKVR